MRGGGNPAQRRARDSLQGLVGSIHGEEGEQRLGAAAATVDLSNLVDSTRLVVPSNRRRLSSWRSWHNRSEFERLVVERL